MTDSSNLLHDFATVVALAELSDEVLGEGGAEAAHANCSKKTATVLVDFFEGGDSFRTFAGRLRVRSGMTAIVRPPVEPFSLLPSRPFPFAGHGVVPEFADQLRDRPARSREDPGARMGQRPVPPRLRPRESPPPAAAEAPAGESAR